MPGKRQRHELTVACDYCDGAGIHRDPEDDTVGVVCAGCGGRGHRLLTYSPFSGRRKVPGIKHVRWAGGAIVPFSTAKRKISLITYAEFTKGKLP